ncbi:putative membrane protein [Candidatus Phytoplasma solani]
MLIKIIKNIFLDLLKRKKDTFYFFVVILFLLYNKNSVKHFF